MKPTTVLAGMSLGCFAGAATVNDEGKAFIYTMLAVVFGVLGVVFALGRK